MAFTTAAKKGASHYGLPAAIGLLVLTLLAASPRGLAAQTPPNQNTPNQNTPNQNAAAPNAAGQSAASEDERLEQYLQRLGLVPLQTLHLEQQLGSIQDGDLRVAKARRLADLYAEQLMQNLGHASKYQEIVTRIEQLLSQVPQAKTASLEVMLLQADYQRAEGLIAQARLDDDPSAALSQAYEILRRITPILQQRQKELWQVVDERVAELERVQDESRLEQLEAELRRHQVVAGRAAYFAGWASYYAGILAEPAQMPDVRMGRSVFRRVLDIREDEPYGELDAVGLELASPWRARAAIGLGLCEAALGDTAACHACFALVQSEGTPPEIRDESDFWYLQALLNAESYDDALQLARSRIASWPGQPTQGRVSFCTALLRAGYQDRQAVAGREEFAQLGVQGFVRLKQFRLLADLLRRYAAPLDERAETFVLRWVHGQRLREQADESRSQEDYARAADALGSALKMPDAEGDPVSLNLCRMELAWCQYQLGKDELAAPLYQQAAEGLRAVKADEAVDAAWMAFVARHRLAQNGQQAEGLWEALNWLREEFPDHAYTKRAEFLAQKQKLRQGSPEEVEKALAAVPPGDPNFVSARLELARLLYERFHQSAAGSDERRSNREALVRVADELTGLPSIRLENDQKLQLHLMRADLALSGENPDPADATDQLKQAAPLVTSAEESGNAELAAEYHYRRMQAARAEGDAATSRQQAAWFVDHGQGTRWELPGLVAAASDIDQRYGEVQGETRQNLAAEGLRVYSRLAERLGDDPEALRSQRNAQVATSRRAQYAYDLGQWSEASESLDLLLAAFPKERRYLRRAGLAAMQLKDHDQALQHWRMLLAGTRAGTGEWYEAKYYQLVCLLEIDRQAAAQVFKQFQLLDPELGTPPWREKFQQLQSRL